VSDLASWLTADILSLGMAADEARRAAHGGVATYLRVYALGSTEIISACVIPAEAGEVRVHDLPASLAEAVDRIATLRARADGLPMAAYSMADLEARAGEGWGAIEDVLRRLVDAGLTDVAELPVDRLADPVRSVRALQAAGAHPRRLTIASPVGDRKLEILDLIAACRQSVATPLYVAPLPKNAPIDKPTTGYEDLRMVALTRLLLSTSEHADRSFVEVDWQLYGPKLAQVALTFGADHLDAVPAGSDASLGPRRATVADVERNIRAAGFDPKELRLTA
jgi:aminodeoxyfutalosine synthase